MSLQFFLIILTVLLLYIYKFFYKMCELIKKWIGNKVGVILDLQPDTAGEIIKDGNIIGKLLHMYGLINSAELNNIQKTKDPKIALQNLNYLDCILRNIGIDCTENDLKSIAHGSNTAAIKLLYQLYLKLSNKNEIHFLAQTKIDGARMSSKSEKDDYFNMVENRKLVKWYEDKYSHFANRKTCKLNEFQMQKDSKTISDTEFQINYLQKNISKEDVLQKMLSEKPDTEISCKGDRKKAKEYLLYLKAKHDKIQENKNLYEYMHNMICDGIMTKIQNKTENEIKNVVTSKLLKQTNAEKQLATKFLEVQNQKNIMKENRLFENNLLLERQMHDITERFFTRDHNISLQEERYRIEQQRQLELHSRLYQAKLEKAYKENYDICSFVLSDIVDLSLKVIEYKTEYEMDVPLRNWKEWKMLVCLEQPVFDSVEKIEEILSEDVDENNEVLVSELCRQNGLDEEEMLNYLHFYYPWNSEESLSMFTSDNEMGVNILGFIVHRLLLTKYPVPTYPAVQVLPSVTLASCLTGIEDESVLLVLQEALQLKGIVLLSMNNAVNYCLEAYLQESNTISDTELKEETHKVKENKSEILKKKPRAKGKKSKDSKKTHNISQMAMVPKETQTPKVFPGEEIKLTKQAELGKFIFETFNLGLTINNYLLVQVFVEYLKSLNHMKGWVLINYPQNLAEAAIFELILSGRCDIDKNYLDCDITFLNDLNPVERNDLFKPPSDPYLTKRISNLVPYILPNVETSESKSYLTSYVHLIKKSQNSTEKKMIENVDSSAPVIEFYTNLKCNNSIYYDTLNNETIKKIIIAITNDPVFANEIYETIIQRTLESAKEKEELERIENERKNREEQTGKKTKADKGKDKNGKDKNKEKKEKGKKGKDKNEVDSKNSADYVQQPQQNLDPTTVKPVEKPVMGKEIIEEKVTYVNKPIPEDFQKILATTWENIEELYLNDFKQFFFLRRVHHNAIIPYYHKIDKQMTKMLSRPDKKQQYLHDFQLLYNQIDLELRHDEETKMELHYRVDEFRTKLNDICFSEMRETEEERISIINENWFCKEAFTLTNLYISAMQLEMDRCICTLQLLEDYYVMMSGQELLETKYHKSSFSNFTFTNEKDPNKTFVKNVYKNEEKNIKHNNPFTNFLRRILTQSLNIMNGAYNISTNSIQTVITKQTTVVKSPKGKKAKVAVPLPPQKDVPNLNLLTKEWTSANEAEYLNTVKRFKLIIKTGIAELEELLLTGQKLFHGFYKKIYNRYHLQISSVKKACEIFGHAIEACEPIEPQLILRGTEFEVNDEVLFVDEILDLAECIKQRKDETKFTTEQVMKLFIILNSLAPTKSIPLKAFLYLIEDMLTYKPKGEPVDLFPPLWYTLELPEISTFVYEIFGVVEYVNWRDFLIYCIEIPFPTENELLAVRRQFYEIDVNHMQFVNQEQFDSVQFWFEEDSDVSSTNAQIFKSMLTKIFSNTQDSINYSELLLTFSKDIEPILGFVKALEVYLGSLICWDEEVGKKYIEICRYENYLKQQEKLQAISTTKYIYEELLHRVTASKPRYSAFSKFSKTKTMNENADIYSVYGEDLSEEACGRLSEYPCLAYFLPLDLILNVMVDVLPWHCKTQCINGKNLREYLEVIYGSLRNDEFDNKVFAHEFLNNKEFTELLKRYNTFVIKSPKEIIKSLVEQCKCEDRFYLTDNEKMKISNSSATEISSINEE